LIPLEQILEGAISIAIVGVFGSLGIEICAGNIKSKAERMKNKRKLK
jgi:hypothetical protein